MFSKKKKKVFKIFFLEISNCGAQKRSSQIFREVSNVFQQNFNGSKKVLSLSRGHGSFQGLETGMWKQKRRKRLVFCGSRSGSALMREVGSESELGSESVEKDLEAQAIFFKSGASGFSNWRQPLG